MQLWIGLVAGLIIGWIVEWIIDWRYWRQESSVSEADFNRLRHELSVTQAALERLQAQVSDSEQPTLESTAERDRLQEIYGIGPAFEKRMNEAGIYTFDDLVATLPQMSTEEVRSMLALQDWQSVDPDSWVTQAQALAHQTAERGG